MDLPGAPEDVEVIPAGIFRIVDKGIRPKAFASFFAFIGNVFCETGRPGEARMFKDRNA
jgi:hypothetical protein